MYIYSASFNVCYFSGLHVKCGSQTIDVITQSIGSQTTGVITETVAFQTENIRSTTTQAEIVEKPITLVSQRLYLSPEFLERNLKYYTGDL